jgi:hypothetical protein
VEGVDSQDRAAAEIEHLDRVVEACHHVEAVVRFVDFFSSTELPG